MVFGLPYVNKLAKDSNGVRYLLFRQDQFDRTVDIKRLKTKDSKETVCAFLILITKKIDSLKFGSTKKQNLLESSKDSAKLSEDNFLLQ